MDGWSAELLVSRFRRGVSELSVYNLGSCNSAALSMGEQRERGVDCRAVQSLVFMAQLKIAALKQAIISLTLHLSLLLSPTLLRYEMSPPSLSPTSSPSPLPLCCISPLFLPLLFPSFLLSLSISPHPTLPGSLCTLQSCGSH